MKKWSFAINNDELVKLVLSGKKTATTSDYDKNNLPAIGEETILCYSNGIEACIVKTIGYKIMKFSEMTDDFVRLEGEGDLSLKYWKDIHYNLFKSYDSKFNKDSLIVFEIFKVTKRFK